LQAKRKISEKLEQLNQAREQIEIIQREIDEMKKQENSSLWQDSPHPELWTNQKNPERKFLRGKWNLRVRGL
jgi:FtsZ-binding cell division protein ZapB